MAEGIAQVALNFHPTHPLTLAFDAPHISSDGGALLLRQMDDRLGLSERLAALLPDARDPRKVKHARREQVRQRLYQIALGYPGGNAADRLRQDPVLKSVCDRSPQAAGLSSQPTLSRLENAVDVGKLRALVCEIEEQYVRSFTPAPEVLIVDIDSTADPTHGQQQLSCFHGYYDQHMSHPLVIFDGERGQLVSAVLRPGNAHAARGAMGVLRRIIQRLKQRWPHVQIGVRGDSAFAVPRVVRRLEDLNRELGGIASVVGLAQNAVLLRSGAAALSEARRRFQATKQTVQHFDAFPSAAESWPQARHVVMKAEVSEHGANPRFVVTSLAEFAPALLDPAYCERGQCENFIKDFKNARPADRLSCSTFAANFFRLLEHAAAYVLFHALRTQVASLAPQVGRAQFDTLRLQLLKVAAIVSQSTRRLLVRLPFAFPLARVFRQLATTLTGLPVLSSACALPPHRKFTLGLLSPSRQQGGVRLLLPSRTSCGLLPRAFLALFSVYLIICYIHDSHHTVRYSFLPPSLRS
jgi:Transposase DDE domain group 1